MAEKSKYTRGEPRAVEWRDAEGNQKAGADLSDVLRDLLLHEMETQGWSQEQVAPLLGVSQATVSRFLKGLTPMKSDELTKLCILLDRNPLRLFAGHPRYFDDTRAKTFYPKDELYKRFVALLRNGEAHDLVDLIQQAQQLGAGRAAIQAVRVAVEAASAAKQKQVRAARKPRRRRGIHKPTQAVTET